MKTYDIAVAAFLCLRGISHSVEKTSGGRGCFVFNGPTNVIRSLVEDFHSGHGDFLLYHHMIRSLKAQINHTNIDNDENAILISENTINAVRNVDGRGI